MEAEESIKRYDAIQSQTGIEFFNPVGFLSVWKRKDLSPDYLDEITKRAEETKSILVTKDYVSKWFPYLR